MSIESITERIMNEANAYSDDPRAQGEAARKATLDDARRQADEVIAKFKANAKTDAEVLKSRRSSVADLDARKMQLAAKQEVIDSCFRDAMNQLLKLEDAKYVQLIMGQVSEFKDQSGEILLNSGDKDRIGAKLTEALAGTKLRVGEDTADISGGCILRQGNISYNASFEKLLENAKSELTTEIAGMLFK